MRVLHNISLTQMLDRRFFRSRSIRRAQAFRLDCVNATSLHKLASARLDLCSDGLGVADDEESCVQKNVEHHRG